VSNQTDWLGNSRSVHATLGSRTGATGERHEQDYYATPPEAVRALLAVENFNHLILEPCCGEGHISKELLADDALYIVESYDLFDRGYGNRADFLCRMGNGIDKWGGDIVTNPPFATALEFIQRSLEITQDGAKVAMLLRTAFLEGQKRKIFFEECPPKTVWQFSKRIACAKNGDFKTQGGGAMAYAWFVWEKGYKGDTVIKWL
jgi:hypothetical protein